MKTRPHTPERLSTTTIATSDLTAVEILWLEKRIENRVRFGRPALEKILDSNRRILSFSCHSACNIDPLSRGIGVQN